jgi:hypothetical protein
MLKKGLIAVLILLALVGFVSCPSAKTDTTPPANVNIIRETTISPNWAMKQMEITLEAETSIMLKLTAGDKVDGYFYLINGDNISFSISGNSLIYESKSAGAAASNVSSDRFSFTASQVQGIAYTFKLTPGNGESTHATVFLELIYPASGQIFIPIGTK